MLEQLQAHTNLQQATIDTSSRQLAVGVGAQQQKAQSSNHMGADSPLRGISLSSAQATLGTGRTLVTDYIMGADNTLAEIRVIDPTTHQIVAASPPETIAQIRQEMLTYQKLGKDAGTQPDNSPTTGMTPLKAAQSAE